MKCVSVVNQTATVIFDDGKFIYRDDLTESEVTDLLAAVVLQNDDRIGEIMEYTLPPVLDNEFESREGSVYLKGIPVSIPKDLVAKLKTADADEKEALIRFWKLAALNPDPAARDNLFWFLLKNAFRITLSGYFLAYRSVKSTAYKGVYTDEYTGTFRIMIGTPVRMPREQCDSVQENTCSDGLHVGAEGWLTEGDFGDTGLACLINPMHVVAVPPSSTYGKMRVCEYLPIECIDWDDQGHVIPPTKTLLFENVYAEYTNEEINNMLKEADILDGDQKVTYNLMEATHVDAYLEEARKTVAERVIS